MKKSNLLCNFKKNWGKCPFCNEKPETAPHIGNFCFPVCWRCFALITSILGTTTCYQLIPHLWTLPIWLCLILMLPTAIDGCLQYFGSIPSTNLRRFLTGIISGFGTSAFLHSVYH